VGRPRVIMARAQQPRALEEGGGGLSGPSHACRLRPTQSGIRLGKCPKARRLTAGKKNPPRHARPVCSRTHSPELESVFAGQASEPGRAGSGASMPSIYPPSRPRMRPVRPAAVYAFTTSELLSPNEVTGPGRRPCFPSPARDVAAGAWRSSDCLALGMHTVAVVAHTPPVHGSPSTRGRSRAPRCA
jgi:hypothetical protein